MNLVELSEAMLREQLYLKALAKYPAEQIKPCSFHDSLWTCFEWYGEETLLLYFNIGKNTFAVTNREDFE